MNKFFSAAMSALISALLVWGHYDSALTSQPASAITAINWAFCGVPLVTCAISLVVMAFYNLDKIYPQIKKDLDENKFAFSVEKSN